MPQKAELSKIKAFAAGEGIALPSVATGLFWKYSLTDDNPAVRQRALAIAEEEIAMAKELGADTVLIVPGAVAALSPDSPVVPYDKAYERALEAMLKLKPIAESQKISIGIENVWNKFLLSPLEMPRFHRSDRERVCRRLF